MPAPKMLEKHLQQYGEDLLMLDDWRIFRIEENFSERKRKRTGERHAADGLYCRYSGNGAAGEILFIEWKRPGGKPRPGQRIWHAAERARGALTWIAGETFPATCEGFKAHYEASGLCRRKLK